MKKDTIEFAKKCHSCQVQANLIHTHLQNLHSMVTTWPFHTWGLNLVGPVNPPSHGCIWIPVATEYFTKWAEAVSLRKVTRGVVANFIKENIIVRFRVPHRIISDNGTPFINNDVRKMLEFYQVKHYRSSPYYPQGNGQVEATKDGHTHWVMDIQPYSIQMFRVMPGSSWVELNWVRYGYYPNCSIGYGYYPNPTCIKKEKTKTKTNQPLSSSLHSLWH